MQSPFENIPPVVKNLIIINIICFLPTAYFSHFFADPNYDPIAHLFGAYYFNSPDFKPWQIITYMFVHGGWMHIFFNMFVLFQFGPIVEYNLGSKRFFNFYFLCGIGAVALQMIVQAIQVHGITGSFIIHDPTADASYLAYGVGPGTKLYQIYHASIVGASGAIEGVMIAFAMLYPNMELLLLFIPVPIKAKYLVPGFLLVEVYMSINQQAGDNVAHLAHIGGAITGALIIWAWRSRQKI